MRFSAVVLSLAFAAAGVSSCSSPMKVREICGNGIDDDNNGFTDCDDIDCAGQSNCPVYDAGTYGTCPKCGTSCASQTSCVGAFVSDRPLPTCESGKCTSFNESIQVNLDLDFSSYNGVSAALVTTLAIRFISKTALDGSAVTCATLASVSKNPDGGAKPENPSAIEQSGKFNVLGLDVFPVANFQPGRLPVPLVSTATASNFLMWVEPWNGARDSDTKMPSGRRSGTGCLESGAGVAPLIAIDNCNQVNRDAGTTCRTISYEMPGPD